jgi:Kdo2-lipid IVA lauroyltransferase/acyltransferase
VLKPARRALRTVVDALEAAPLFAAVGLVGLLPPERASNIGAAIARTIGPHLPVSRRALRNLERAFPEMGEAERRAVLREVWDNLGRVGGEYPHVRAIADPEGGRLELVGAETLRRLTAGERPVVFVAGHLANFELFAPVTRRLGCPLALVYRASNNPITDRIVQWARRDATELIPKGAAGARRITALMKAGGRLGLLVDQKMNDGIPVPFFGRDAMTAPAAAHLALRYGARLGLARVERLGPARYRLSLEELELPDIADHHAAIDAVMRRINARLEEWIRERPGEWLWLHRRWPD